LGFLRALTNEMRKLVGCSAARPVEGETAGRAGGPGDHLSNLPDAHAIGIFALNVAMNSRLNCAAAQSRLLSAQYRCDWWSTLAIRALISRTIDGAYDSFSCCRLIARGYWTEGGATTRSLRPASSNARRTMPDAFASSIKAVA